MLSKKGIEILKYVNFDIGKYLICLNTGGSDGINYFNYYTELKNHYKKKIKEVKKNLKTWQLLSQKNKENMALKDIAKKDIIIKNEITDAKELIKGLSKAILNVTTLSTDNKIDPIHFDDNAFTTEILENIQELNKNIKILEETIIGSQLNPTVACLNYEKDLQKFISRYTNLILSHETSEKTMENRIDWFCEISNINKSEANVYITESAKKYVK